jgi:hypothetical protein
MNGTGYLPEDMISNGSILGWLGRHRAWNKSVAILVHLLLIIIFILIVLFA